MLIWKAWCCYYINNDLDDGDIEFIDGDTVHFVNPLGNIVDKAPRALRFFYEGWQKCTVTLSEVIIYFI